MGIGDVSRRSRTRRKFLLGADIDHLQAALRRVGQRAQCELDIEILAGNLANDAHNRARDTRRGAAP